MVRLSDIASSQKKQEPTMQQKVELGQLPPIDPRQSEMMQQVNRMASIQPNTAQPTQQQKPGRDIPVVGHALRALDAVAESAPIRAIAEYAMPDAPYIGQPGTNVRQDFLQRTGAEPATGVSKVIGQAIAPFAVPGGGLGTGNQLYQASSRTLQAAAPKLGNTLGGRVAGEAIKGVATGAPIAAGIELTQGSGDLGKAGEQALYGGLAGGVLGGATPLVGSAISRLFKRNNLPEAQAQEILALPAPRQRGNVNTAVTDDVINQPGTITPLGLPEPNLAPPTVARVGTRVNPYRQQFEDLISRAKQLEAEGKLTPGREDVEVESLWSQMAGPDSPSLDELINLAYPSQQSRITPDLVSRARQNQASREVAGVPLPVRSLSERYPNGTVARAGAPIERVGRSNALINELSPEVAPATQPVVNNIPPQPRVNNGNMVERGFAQTLKESDKTSQGFKDTLKSAYRPITNEQTLNQANKRINKDVEEATSFVLGNSRFTAEKATTAQRLIDHYNSTGNVQRAVDIAQKVSEEATRAGQSIQALSMFNRLSPEGVLVYAQRAANKANESIPIGAKEIKVTPEIATNITGLASSVQRMTGVKELSNNVMDILEKAKAGTKLSDTEAQELKRFVSESKQFVQETTRNPRPPREPRMPKESRVRDNVVSFLDAQEQAAKERLRSRGIQISSTPLDIWADYAIIGASKMGKGVVKFTDWSEQMVKDLGEEVRPHLQNLYERSRQAFEESTKKVTQQSVSTAERLTERVIKTKELSQTEANSLRLLAQKVSGLSGDAKRLASQDLQAILQGFDRPSVLKKVSTAQTIGQLLNPKTQVRNVLGNELFYRLERLNKLIATPIDIARSKITGGERTVTFRTNNQGEFWNNFIRGAQAGWKGVNVNGLETQYDLGSPAFKSKYNPLMYMEKALGAALKSFDTAAYMRAYNNTLGEQATLRLINEGQPVTKAAVQKYIREVDDNIMKIADEYGRYVTFQDNNVISQGMVKLKKGLNVGKDFGIGDLVLKYPKTPGALLMRALEYSPAGFVRSASILARPLLKKEPNTAEVTQALTRAIIGTAGLSGMGYFLMDKGVITGSASKDKDIRGLQQSAGQGQYQVNLSALLRLVKGGFDPSEAELKQNDYLYTYDWMQPASIAISVGANTAKNLNDGKEGLSGLPGTVYNSLEGGLGTLTEQSLLSGLKQAAQGYPGQTVTDKIMDILSDIPASFVPTAFNQVKQLNDNARRETYSPNKLEQSLNRAQAKIPGLSEKLPKQYDTLGREKETYQNNSLFNVMLNPGFSSRYTLTPEAKYIVDLINETGDESLAPRVPGKTITIDGQSVKLNGDMFSRMQQLQGEETSKLLSKRAENDANKRTEVKSRNVSKSLTEAGERARKQLKKELP